MATAAFKPQARGRLTLPAAAIGAFLLAAPVGAASLQVAPTSLTLQAQQNADGLWLSNSGTEPLTLQVRAYRWDQGDGEDRLVETREIVASPPMQSLAPGARQLVRIIRTVPAPSARESAYRLIVDELPRPSKQPGLQFVLRYSIPVFLAPASPTAPELHARLVAGPDGEGLLEVTNAGQQHAQLADLAFARGKDGNAASVLPGLVGYVLPGQTMRWPLKASAGRFADGVFLARINGAADASPLATASAAP